jgi:hypothetical protein
LVFKEKRGIQRRKFDLSGIGGKGGDLSGYEKRALRRVGKTPLPSS